jgi:hypothetical protein
VHTIKSKDVSGKMFSIDNLALKLAHDKVNYLSDVTSGSEDGCDVSNRNCDKVVEDEGKDMIGGEEDNDLSRIIREIYERSLKRDKLVDDKIKTLADIVTKSFQENSHEGALHDNEVQAENNGVDTDKAPEEMQPVAFDFIFGASRVRKSSTFRLKYAYFSSIISGLSGTRIAVLTFVVDGNTDISVQASSRSGTIGSVLTSNK